MKESENRLLKYRVEFDRSYYTIGSDEPNTREVTTTFFSDERGYETSDLGRIIMLEVGETLKLDNGNQKVTRIQ